MVCRTFQAGRRPASTPPFRRLVSTSASQLVRLRPHPERRTQPPWVAVPRTLQGEAAYHEAEVLMAASLLDELPYPPGSMCSEVIHDHHLSSFEAGREHLLYVGLEYPSGGRSFYGKRWSHPQEGHA